MGFSAVMLARELYSLLARFATLATLMSDPLGLMRWQTLAATASMPALHVLSRCRWNDAITRGFRSGDR